MRHCARGKRNHSHRSSVSRSLTTDTLARASKIASRRDDHETLRVRWERSSCARVVSRARPRTRERDARDAHRETFVRSRDGGFATHRSRTLARVALRGGIDERARAKSPGWRGSAWPIMNLYMGKQCDIAKALEDARRPPASNGVVIARRSSRTRGRDRRRRVIYRARREGRRLVDARRDRRERRRAAP